MRADRLASLASRAFGYDTETWLSEPGVLAPRHVCAAISATDDSGMFGVDGELLDREGAIAALEQLLADPTAVIVGAFLPFDLLVIACALAVLGRDILPAIWRAVEEERLFDVLVGQALDDNAVGMLGMDQRTGGPLRHPTSNKTTSRQSLETVVDIVLGRIDAKVNDEYRLRYRELDGVPLERWPLNAKQYPVDDTCNAHEVALAMAGIIPKASTHRWMRAARPYCGDCGQLIGPGVIPPCMVRRQHRNLHALGYEVAMAWAMWLGAAWGFRVNQERVDVVERETLRERAEIAAPLRERGWLKVTRKNGEDVVGHDKAAIARAVALAYGATGKCEACAGTGRVVTATGAKRVSACPQCGVKAILGRPGCQRCGAGCRKCSATGLDLSTAPQLTLSDPSDMYPDGQISASRDVLSESGDEMLGELGAYDETAKTVSVYVPYLRGARRWSAERSCWVDVPLTLSPNVFLETDRTSYGGSIHQFPRAPGYKTDDGRYVPSLRECIEARPGYSLCSTDYEAGEMITHAQSCLWICGFSNLARALLAGDKPHNAVGARMLGITYEEFQRITESKLAEDKPRKGTCKDARQAAKPINFGAPGGIGPAKIVLQQRKQGPDTPHPSGPAMVDDGSGKLVRGYRGLRFCILMDKAPRCGEVMTREWGHQHIPPTCRRCIQCAARLRDIWFEQWPENKPYFAFVTDAVANGQQTLADIPVRAGLVPWPRDGKRLDPGQVMLHVSRILRGGVGFCDGANGFFQALLARAAKLAFTRIQRECTDVTCRVPDMLYGNSVRSAYANGPSPLLGARAIVLQHDETLAEIPRSVEHDGATRQSEIMRDTLRHTCPDMAPACRAEPALQLSWLKAATPWYARGGAKPADASDRLVPWTLECK